MDTAEICKLHYWWEGPFKVIKEAVMNAYLLKVVKLFWLDPTVNVDSLLQPVAQAGESLPVCSASWTNPWGSARLLQG